MVHIRMVYALLAIALVGAKVAFALMYIIHGEGTAWVPAVVVTEGVVFVGLLLKAVWHGKRRTGLHMTYNHYRLLCRVVLIALAVNVLYFVFMHEKSASSVVFAAIAADFFTLSALGGAMGALRDRKA